MNKFAYILSYYEYVIGIYSSKDSIEKIIDQKCELIHPVWGNHLFLRGKFLTTKIRIYD